MKDLFRIKPFSSFSDYNGILIISRERNGLGMPNRYKEEFKRVTSKFNIDYDEMCLNNNDNCIL